MGARILRHGPSGRQTFTDGGQCTANFVFYDATDIYIGQAAHCSGTGGATETNGCDSGSLPLGTPVEVDGASQPGTLVYNSWLAMQAKGETDANTCDYNDFALVKLNPADHGKVNPSVPFWGGPNAVGATTQLRDKVYSYGNSSLRGGVSQLSPKEGYSLGQGGGGWTPQRLHRDPRHPGRLRQRVPVQDRRSAGHAQHRRDRPAHRLQRRRRPAARVQLHEGQQRLQRRLAGPGHRALPGRLAAVGLNFRPWVAVSAATREPRPS